MSSLLEVVSGAIETVVTLPASDISSYSQRTWGVAWKNLGPLWSTFTPPGSCKTITTGDYWVFSSVTKFDAFERTQYVSRTKLYRCESWLTSSEYLSAGCVPSALESSKIIVGNWLYGELESAIYAAFHSPGLVCPSAWRAVGAYTLPPSVTSSGAIASVPTWASYLVHTGGTHIVCCPSGWSHFSQGFQVDAWDGFYPIQCSSRVATATTGEYCNRCLTDSLVETTKSGTKTSVCPNQTSFTWKPAQTETTLGYTVNAIYMIHHKKDLDGPPPPSAASIIIPSVLLPVIALSLAIFCMMRFLRRRRRQHRQDATKSPHGTKFDQDLKDIDRSSPIDPELDGIARHELEPGNYHPGAELSAEHGVQELAIGSTNSELENTSRHELMGAAPSIRLEQQPQPTARMPLVANQTEQTSFDNRPFERYPVVNTLVEPISTEAQPPGTDRLASLHAERNLLNQHIRQMQMEELLEQRRRIDDEISGLRP